MDKRLIRNFRNIVGEKYCFDGVNDLYAYSYDATPLLQAMPDLVLSPGCVEEVQQILKLANKKRIPIVSRGSGTNLSGGIMLVVVEQH
ncbi:MAG: FAD-binding oxidoreductase [Bacillaceae bacterium]